MSLAAVLAFILGFDAAPAFGFGVDLDLLLTGSRNFIRVIVLHREVVLQGCCRLALASGGHVDACFLEFLFVLGRFFL